MGILGWKCHDSVILPPIFSLLALECVYCTVKTKNCRAATNIESDDDDSDIDSSTMRGNAIDGLLADVMADLIEGGNINVDTLSEGEISQLFIKEVTLRCLPQVYFRSISVYFRSVLGPFWRCFRAISRRIFG